MRRETLGSDHPDVAHSLQLLGVAFWKQLRHADAEGLFREALEIQRKLDQQGKVADLLWLLGETLSGQSQHPEAEAAYRESLSLRRKLHGNPEGVAAALASLTRNMLAQGKYIDAEPLARECLALFEESMSGEWQPFCARSLLGGSLLGQKKYAEAEPLLVSGYEGMEERESQIPSAGRPFVGESLLRLVQFYEATDQPAKAGEWREKLAEFDQATIPGREP